MHTPFRGARRPPAVPRVGNRRQRGEGHACVSFFPIVLDHHRRVSRRGRHHR